LRIDAIAASKVLTEPMTAGSTWSTAPDFAVATACSLSAA